MWVAGLSTTTALSTKIHNGLGTGSVLAPEVVPT